MIGQLVSKDTRTVYSKKVVRLTIDVPFMQVRDAERDGQDLLEFLDQQVDSEISVRLGGVEDEGQELIGAEE